MMRFSEIQGGREMFVQIFLGALILIFGICHLLKVKSLLRKTIINNLSEHEIASFQRGLVLPFFLSGTTFIVMGFIEKQGIFPTTVFLAIYIFIGAISLTMILLNTKKHTEQYFM